MAKIPHPKSALEEIFLSVDRIGLKRTAACLVRERYAHSLQEHEDACWVRDVMTRSFKISEEEILYGVGRKNDRKFAVGLCVYYLHYVKSHAMLDVAMMLSKTTWICYKFVKEIENAQEGEIDRRVVNWKKRFDKLKK